MLETLTDAGLTGLGWLLLTMAFAGIVYCAATVIAIRSFFTRPRTPVPRDEAVTLLKPLCGAEPMLEENLRSFLVQDHQGPVQVLFGYATSDDEAAHAVAALRHGHPDIDIATVVSGVRHGPSAKVSNLINLDAQARHPVVILSDSDMAVGPDYLSHVLDALDEDDVGAVSLLYAGRGDSGFWSRLGAAGVSYQFLPNAIFGVWSSLATPCMGSTIAIRRETLERVGGFKAFTDRLADDYAIGQAVRGVGLTVSVPPHVITHACNERSFLDLWRHEVRWATTVRGLVPLCHVGSVITHPLPLAMLGAWAADQYVIGSSLAATALVVRTIQAMLIDRIAARPTATLWLLPLRDCLTFAIFVTSFFARRVQWRGSRLVVQPRGRLATDQEYLA